MCEIRHDTSFTHIGEGDIGGDGSGRGLARVLSLIISGSIVARHVANLCLFVTVAFVLVAVAMVSLVSQQAEGSGIPQVKSIMFGLYLKNMLNWQTYVAKLVGTTAMLCSGLSLGKEGPFVHMSAIIADNLPWRWFDGNNNTLRHQMLTASIAVGVTATFGAPIGGVLFSIELTSHIYNISNLWKAFYSAFIAVLLFKAI